MEVGSSLHSHFCREMAGPLQLFWSPGLSSILCPTCSTSPLLKGRIQSISQPHFRAGALPSPSPGRTLPLCTSHTCRTPCIAICHTVKYRQPHRTKSTAKTRQQECHSEMDWRTRFFTQQMPRKDDLAHIFKKMFHLHSLSLLFFWNG